MCWQTKNGKYIERKTAERDIHVFKIVLQEKGRIYSYFQDFEYKLNKTYYHNDPLYIDNGVIFEGFHSYCDKCGIDKGDAVLFIEKLSSDEVLEAYEMYNIAIMKCIVPRGAQYFENDDGEIVSNMLKTISIEKI